MCLAVARVNRKVEVFSQESRMDRKDNSWVAIAGLKLL